MKEHDSLEILKNSLYRHSMCVAVCVAVCVAMCVAGDDPLKILNSALSSFDFPKFLEISALSLLVTIVIRGAN